MEKTRVGRFSRRATATIAASSALALAFGGVALADTLQDTIADTGTGVTLEAGSITAGTAAIRLIGNNASGDPDPGCNIDAGENPLRLDIVTPTGVTATPDPLSITSCGTDFTVSFTASSTAVSGHVTVSVLSGPAGGGTYVNQVDIPITITQPNTAPVVSVTGVTDGDSFVIGDEPSPACSVVDAEQPTLTTTPRIDTSGLVNGLGQVTVSCSITDAGGLSDSDSVGYTIVAPPNTAPEVSVTGISAASYEVGSEPTPGCSVTDAEEPDLTATPTVDTSRLTHGLGQVTVTCSAEDAGGLEGSDTVSYTVVDTGDPTIQGSIAPTGPNGANGWYVSYPTITFSCSDGTGSGIKRCVVDGGETSTTTLGEGENQSVSGTATDWASNTATATVSDIDVDMTNPTATFDTTIGSVYFGSVPAAPACTSTDAVSGPDGCVVSGYSTAVGTHTLIATAKDKAGRTGTTSLTYTVRAWTQSGFYSPVDMNGVWNTVKGGSTVPLKFELFAGTTELTATSAITGFTVRGTACPGASASTDAIELTTTGGTTLRYDTTAGQFIQNWATPKKPGSCYSVSVTTADGTTHPAANFILK